MNRTGNERDIRAETVPGVTYFIRAGDAIKIGSATHFKRRLHAVQTAHEKPIEVLAVIPMALVDEFKTHQQFAHLRIRGEWFRVEQDLLDFIDALKVEAEKPVRPRHPADPVIAQLSALRSKQPRESRVHGIISNLIEALGNLMRETDPAARRRLEHNAAKSTKLVGQLLTTA